LLVDQELEIIKANQQAAEIYGMPIQNLVGSDVRQLTDEQGMKALMGFFDKLVEGQRFSGEITGVYIDGRTFPTDVTVTRIDYDGKKFWTIIVHDITEHKALEQKLFEEKSQIEEMNITLKNVLNTIEKDRRDFEGRLSARIRTSILPALEKVEKEADASVRKSYLMLLGQQITALTSGSDTGLDAGLLKLSKTELGVCRLIQAGCSSKEICEAMNLSFETIQTHRKNIRRKLRLRGRKVNLHAFLSNRVIDSAGSTSQEGEFIHE
ncbi:MAG TPA: PAS domain S-box protein, partial [Deltaproteobacteria bacterium]|nr:PAS domain S-box protein [Deltaproteobacteria bacterium]HQM21520.1 PAS domain S-box protein [Deltaproteobacteria bacterium]HRC98816.1 PAS domain S-box protein [Deltaproteobacteria bacterium]